MQLINNDNLKHLNPVRSVYSILGNICTNTSLLRDPDVKITEDDFLQDFHKIVFSAMNNIVYTGADTISEVDIDNALAPHSTLHKIWQDNNGIDYMRKAIQHSNESTFRYNYELLKKYSFLRYCISKGFSVKDIFDFENIDLKVYNTGVKTIESMTLDELIGHFTLKMNELKTDWSLTKHSKSFKAGDDLSTLLDELNEKPEFGYAFQNPYYNAIFYGMRKKKFMLRSAATGGGKTRQALADMCSISCAQIFDIYQKKWVPNGKVKPTLFISTELEKREVQTIMLAFITGIPENIIKEGSYSATNFKLLKYGMKILEEAPIFCEYVDDFTIDEIESLVEKNILTNEVEYVAFDYIQITPKLASSMRKIFGDVREDQILVQFSGRMKMIANNYDIFIESSTQLNRKHKDDTEKDTNSLRGGSSTADKVDHGILSFRATKKDHENLKHILSTNQFDAPNFSHWIYKNRSGRTGLVIWTKMNLGNLREEICFLTDTDLNLIQDIEPLNLNQNVNENDEAEQIEF